jgi:hypothetical protein
MAFYITADLHYGRDLGVGLSIRRELAHEALAVGHFGVRDERHVF